MTEQQIELTHARFEQVRIVATPRPDGRWDVDLHGPYGPVLLGRELHRDEAIEHAYACAEREGEPC